MEFFNSLIDDVLNMCDSPGKVSMPFSDSDLWQDIGYNQVILQRDTSSELNGTGFNLVTSDDINDEIILIGEDLCDISGKSPFARISLIQIENEEDEQKAYNLIRKIEYVKYHFFPQGYMIRTTSQSHKEAVRVSKDAVKKGISFQKIGSLLIEKYKQIPAVKGVKVIFITAPDADFNLIESVAQKNRKITETLNHIMNSVMFDCDSCNLKAVCDEVEGMKELHFKNTTKKGM